MLLPLLGACVLVGPFHGSEWEPVRGLISRDRSCRDLRCCGNLLILCLFLIWQVRHTWWQVTRTHPSMRKVIKVPLQKWAVPSVRHATFFRLAPESFISPGKLRGLDAHVQQWAQKQRWGYQRSLKESWDRHLQSWQRRDKGLSWNGHNPSEPIFCTASFSSSSLLSQDSSWEVWQVPWHFRDGQTHRICKPLLPASETCHRMEQPLVHSQEESVPLEPVVSIRSHPTSMTLATSHLNLPSTQRLQSWPGEFLPAPSNQQLETPIWKSQGCLQEAWVQGREDQELSRGEDIKDTQASGLGNQREIREEDSRETQASGRQLSIDFGIKDDTETEVLGWGSQRLLVSETEGEIMPPGQENQDHMEGDNRTKIQEPGKEFLKGPGGRETEIQAHRRENQEQFRCKIDAETQTPEWRHQDNSRGEDAVETQAFERKNKKEARGEDERKTQAQGLGAQGQSGGENGTEIQAGKRINKDQVGGEAAVQTQTSGTENLGEAKEEAGVETQTPGWKNQSQDGSEKAAEAQAFRGADQIQVRHEIQVGWGNQDLEISEDSRETQISRRKSLREIREEDWVVIQALWWGNQRLAASEIDREFKIPHWGNQIGGEHGAEIQAPEKIYQSEDGVEDGINTLATEAENQGQFRAETDGETHPPEKRNQEQVGDGNGADIQAPGSRALRGVRIEEGKETQEHGEENQSQIRSEINGKTHMPKWKEQEFIRGKHGTNTQAFEAENWGMLTSKIDGGTHLVEWQVGEQIGGENGTENQTPEKGSQKETGGENGTEIWAAGEENQIQLQSDTDRKPHLSEWKNEEQKRGESGTETKAQEKRKQREGRGEDGVQTQRFGGENQGQFKSEIYEESHSPERGKNWKQNISEKSAGNQASENRSQREVVSEGAIKIQRLGREKPRRLRSKVNGKTSSLEWKNREPAGGEDGADIQIQGKKNLRGAGVADDLEAQVSGQAYQEQLRSEIAGEIQTQGQGKQNKVGDEDAAAVEDVGSQRKCRAEDFGGPQIPRGENKNQVTGKDVAKANHQVDCSGGEGPSGRNLSLARTPALSGCGCGAMEQKEAMAVNNSASAPCLEMRSLSHWREVFLLASGEREHLTGQDVDPARKHKAGVSSASQQAQPESWKGPQKDKVMHPGKASSLTWEPWNPQSLAAPFRQPSACPSLLCGPASQTVAALVAAPIALTILSKKPFLKKSKRLLLESLMRRKIAHLKWGLPQRILQSYLLFNVLEPLSLVGVRLPGLYTSHELQGQQERHCEAKGSRLGIKPPEKPPRVRPPGRKSSKLPTQAGALEKCGPHSTEPLGSSTHPVKPKRSRPPGGARQPQGIQEGPPRAPFPAPRSPRPAAEFKAGRPSSENSRSRKIVRPGVSQMARTAPRRARTPGSRAGHDDRRKTRTSWESSKPPRHKFQQPTHQRRGSLGPLEGRGAGRWPSSCSTDTSGFKGSFHSAAARLSMTLWNKMSWSSQVVKPQHSAPNPSLQDPGPTLLPRVKDPHTSEGSTGFNHSLKRNLEPPGGGAALPGTESPQDLRAPGNSKEIPQSPLAPKKFGFMKRWKCFLQLGFRK